MLLCSAIAGWVDATTGALMPAIRTHYKIDFIVASMLFVGNLAGWIIAAFVTTPLIRRLGYGATLAIAATLSLVPPIVFLPRPPFPVLVIAMAVSGVSNGMFEALANTWISRRPRHKVRLGVLHFLYGVGALVAPLAAIPFAEQRNGLPFSFFYFITLGISLSTTAAVVLTFRLQPDSLVDLGAATEDLAPTEKKYSTQSAALGEVLRNRNVWVLSAFTLLYVGSEVSIGGWTSSFLSDVRGEAVATTNLLVSAFWGGLALGRVVLIPLTWMLGERLAGLVYLSLALGLELVIWLVPSLVGNAVSLALQGIALGPLFPMLVHIASNRFHRDLLTSAIGFFVSFGSAGSALFPLVIGIAAEGKGIRILPPILVSLIATQTLIWVLLSMPCMIEPSSSEEDQACDVETGPESDQRADDTANEVATR